MNKIHQTICVMLIASCVQLPLYGATRSMRAPAMKPAVCSTHHIDTSVRLHSDLIKAMDAYCKGKYDDALKALIDGEISFQKSGCVDTDRVSFYGIMYWDIRTKCLLRKMGIDIPEFISDSNKILAAYSVHHRKLQATCADLLKGLDKIHPEIWEKAPKKLVSELCELQWAAKSVTPLYKTQSYKPRRR